MTTEAAQATTTATPAAPATAAPAPVATQAPAPALATPLGHHVVVPMAASTSSLAAPTSPTTAPAVVTKEPSAADLQAKIDELQQERVQDKLEAAVAKLAKPEHLKAAMAVLGGQKRSGGAKAQVAAAEKYLRDEFPTWLHDQPAGAQPQPGAQQAQQAAAQSQGAQSLTFPTVPPAAAGTTSPPGFVNAQGVPMI